MSYTVSDWIGHYVPPDDFSRFLFVRKISSIVDRYSELFSKFVLSHESIDCMHTALILLDPDANIGRMMVVLGLAKFVCDVNGDLEFSSYDNKWLFLDKIRSYAESVMSVLIKEWNNNVMITSFVLTGCCAILCGVDYIYRWLCR